VHPKYKTKYHVGNWPEYERTLLMNGQRSEIRENGWVEIEDQALETGQRKWKHRFG